MRQLKAKDIGPFTKILFKMEIKDVLKDVFSKEESTGRDVLIRVTDVLIDNYYKAEADFLKFVSDVAEKDVAQIEDLSIPEFISLIKEIFKDITFFNSAAK
jgi:hypothetical protein